MDQFLIDRQKCAFGDSAVLRNGINFSLEASNEWSDGQPYVLDGKFRNKSTHNKTTHYKKERKKQLTMPWRKIYKQNQKITHTMKKDRVLNVLVKNLETKQHTMMKERVLNDLVRNL